MADTSSAAHDLAETARPSATPFNMAIHGAVQFPVGHESRHQPVAITDAYQKR